MVLRSAFNLYRFASGVARQFIIACLMFMAGIFVGVLDLAFTSAHGTVAVALSRDVRAFVDPFHAMTDRWRRWYTQAVY